MTKKVNSTKDPKAEAGNKKIGFDHVPLSSFVALSKGMQPGVPKYGAKNWYEAEALNMNVYLNGMLRHWLLLQAGEDYVRDVEGLVHHLDAIISGCAVLKDAMTFGKCVDDRVKMNDECLNRFAAEICGQDYADLELKRGDL